MYPTKLRFQNPQFKHQEKIFQGQQKQTHAKPHSLYREQPCEMYTGIFHFSSRHHQKINSASFQLTLQHMKQ